MNRFGIDASWPALALGTANWGARVNAATAHAIADAAFDQGLRFFDTAEGYPAPMTLHSHGKSECILGAWLGHKSRGEVTLASKVFGPSRYFRRGAPTRLEPSEIRMALEGSLRRLGTDYLDLYLLHWPDSEDYDEFLGGTAADRQGAQAAAMGNLCFEGKLRAWGLSNAPRAIFRAYCQAADDVGAPHPAIVQNRFSLAADPMDMAREPVPLMAYGIFDHGGLAPNTHAPSFRHARDQVFTHVCCIGVSSELQIGDLMRWSWS